MRTLLDAFPRPRLVTLLGASWRVPVFTLNDLADLQAFVRDQSWDPWAIPREALAATDSDPAWPWIVTIAKAEDWPPRLWSQLASASVGVSAVLVEFVRLAIGRHHGLTLAQCDGLAHALNEREWAALFSAAYDTHPADEAALRINQLDRPDGCEGDMDWPEAVEKLCEAYQVLPAAVAALTLTEFRLLRNHGQPVSLPPARRRGETLAEARTRRVAEVQRARERLAAWHDARRAATPTEDQSSGR